MRTSSTIRFFNLSLALLPILDVYATVISGISFGQLFLLIASVIVIIEYYQYLRVDKSCLALLIYIVVRFLFSTFEVYVNLSTLAHDLISETLFIFFLIIVCNFFNLTVFRKYYLKASILVGALAVIQFVLYSFFHVTVVFILPGIPLTAGVSRMQLITRFSRVESCFSEPAHLVQFLAVALILLLAKQNKSYKDYLTVIFFVAICVMTYSGNAVVLLGLLYLTLCCICMKVRKYRLRVFASVVVILASVLTLYATNEEFRSLINRVDEITGKSAISFSGYVRVLRGYDLYFQFPAIYKLFGTGYGGIAEFCDYFHLQSRVVIDNSNPLYSYLNGIHYYLTGGGIIGFILFLYLLFHGKGKNDLHTYALIVYIGFSLIAAMQGSCIGLILLSIILTNKQTKQSIANTQRICVGDNHEKRQVVQ